MIHIAVICCTTEDTEVTEIKAGANAFSVLSVQLCGLTTCNRRSSIEFVPQGTKLYLSAAKKSSTFW